MPAAELVEGVAQWAALAGERCLLAAPDRFHGSCKVRIGADAHEVAIDFHRHQNVRPSCSTHLHGPAMLLLDNGFDFGRNNLWIHAAILARISPFVAIAHVFRHASVDAAGCAA
jgi:hypothetical protein